jgi:hypothetical protein
VVVCVVCGGVWWCVVVCGVVCGVCGGGGGGWCGSVWTSAQQCAALQGGQGGGQRGRPGGLPGGRAPHQSWSTRGRRVTARSHTLRAWLVNLRGGSGVRGPGWHVVFDNTLAGPRASATLAPRAKPPAATTALNRPSGDHPSHDTQPPAPARVLRTPPHPTHPHPHLTPCIPPPCSPHTLQPAHPGGAPVPHLHLRVAQPDRHVAVEHVDRALVHRARAPEVLLLLLPLRVLRGRAAGGAGAAQGR